MSRSKSLPVAYGPEWLLRRQQGRRNPMGSNFTQMHQYASSYDFTLLSTDSRFGGIFSLEYSPTGSILVAATEQKALLLYDPYRQRLIKTIPDAQDGCINAVKFMDSNTFASCSDDCTIAIWDLRKLDQKVHQLCGHKNWVKSIEKIDNRLMSSAFDGTILSWNFAESLAIPSYQTIFKVNGLMRTRVSSDGTKLVITTAAGYIIVIHNLDLDTLSQDLSDFQPNLYRLMQMCKTPLRACIPSTQFFKTHGKRNRVEFIVDFPEDNDAEVIASLAIFPDGNHILTRNTSHNEVNEYTCVHSILEIKDDEGEEVDEKRWSDVVSSHKTATATFVIPPSRDNDRQDDLALPPNDVWEALVTVQDARASRSGARPVTYLRAAIATHRSFGRSSSNASGQGSSQSGQGPSMRMEFETNETIRRNHTAPIRVENIRRVTRRQAAAEQNLEVTLDIIRRAGRINSNSRAVSPDLPEIRPNDEEYEWLVTPISCDERIHKNKKKYIGFIPEPNTGKGFIKEQAISRDGRLIISPYNNSVRILALSPSYLEPWQCDASNYPQRLTIVKELPVGPVQVSSGEYVCCTQFSPLDKQIVAGTLSGKIAVFNPLRE